MPELPEVETTVRDLRKKLIGKVFFDVWAETEEIIKRPKKFEDFKKELLGREILGLKRRGKNIIFFLSSGKILLIHQKLTGHLLLGIWEQEEGIWKSKIKGPLSEDPMNGFLRLIFFFNDGWQLALSDLRKFAKVEILNKEELEKELGDLGPEPLEEGFTFEKFKERILKKKKGKIKQVLMDQRVIAGIGNIYSDEILWKAKVHPLREVKELKEEELRKIYEAMREILPKAIELKGESFLTYRTIFGEKGEFDRMRKVYRREGENCFRCGFKIERLKLSQRSAHFCPNCQRL
jgi:formamidopyrimidine-DNA glycosylase